MDYTAIILASGLSERMGKPKALLQWDDATTFLEKIINEYDQANCKRIICVVNKKVEPFCKNFQIPGNVTFVINQHPEWGRFYAVKIASQQAQNSQFCFFQNVDNPFIRVEIIQKLFAEKHSDAWCSPVYKGKGGHPVLLPTFIIQKIAQSTHINITLHDILTPIQRIKVEINSDTILRNINTPEDYTYYFHRKL